MKKEINPIVAVIAIVIVIAAAITIGWRMAVPSGPGTEPQPPASTVPPPPAPPGTYFPPMGGPPVRVNPEAAPNPENPMLDMQRK
jgi:hypothetical protein